MDVQSEIFWFLCEKGGWVETVEIRDFFARGHDAACRKSDVNPHLYALEKQGKITKDTSSGKPRWRSAQNDTTSNAAPQQQESNASDARPSSCQTPDLASAKGEVENAKGRLLTLFGQHAVSFANSEENGRFRATAQVGQQEPRAGELCSTKAAAQQSAAEAALQHLRSHPKLIPQESPSGDWKGRLQQQAVQASGTLPCYKTVPSKNGGFVSTVTVGAQESESLSLGRRKIDAEQFAARLALEQLQLSGKTPVAASSSVDPPAALAATTESTLEDAATALQPSISTCVDAVDKDLQIEALREQCEEHEKLKQLLQSSQDYNKIRGNFSQCIKAAYRDGAIDEEEKKRLQVVNGRGNCAKHNPEKLRPKQPDAASSSTEPQTSSGSVSCPVSTPEASAQLLVDFQDMD